MKSQILGLRVAGIFFGLVCIGHALRLVTRIDVVVAGWQVPLWMTAVGFLLAGALSVWMWKLSASRVDDDKKA
jgi:hypothetical protein